MASFLALPGRRFAAGTGVGGARAARCALVLSAALALPTAAGCRQPPPDAENTTAASRPAGSNGAARLKPAAIGLGPDGALRPSAEDRCPVCAMRPAHRPKSAAGLALHDGRTFYFCGNGCLLRAHRHPERYLATSREAVARAVALDYFTGRPIDAQTAVWIAGSDVVGPMGPAIVALSSDGDADRFTKRHGGAIRFRLEDLDDALWSRIRGLPR